MTCVVFPGNKGRLQQGGLILCRFAIGKSDIFVGWQNGWNLIHGILNEFHIWHTYSWNVLLQVPWVSTACLTKQRNDVILKTKEVRKFLPVFPARNPFTWLALSNRALHCSSAHGEFQIYRGSKKVDPRRALLMARVEFITYLPLKKSSLTKYQILFNLTWKDRDPPTCTCTKDLPHLL